MNARSADALLCEWRRAARTRRAVIVAAFAMPWLAALLAFALLHGNRWAFVVFALALLATAVAAWRVARGVDASWLARRLDVRRSDMEDSAALLFAGSTVTALEGLQRERLRQRIEAAPTTELRDPWPRRALAVAALPALAALALVVYWPATGGGIAPTETDSTPQTAGKSALPRLLSARLEIRPPAYTGLAVRTQSELDATAPQGATLRWTLRFSPQPESATLQFHDGRKVELQRHDRDWTGELRLARSGLYRIVLPTPLPKAQSGLHRLDASADDPPVLRVLQPARNLSLHQPGQRTWPLRFEAEDDHGLAATARLRVIQVRGTGEDIVSSERSLALRGSGTARSKRWSHALDLGALGLTAGDDVIVQVLVADNRTPGPQQTRSPSFILRWPPEDTMQASGMDGLAGTRLPAYLRSQRQVIIDAEALLQGKRRLSAERFRERSDALGGDQHALRLRYGRFLGEEGENAPVLPTNDVPTNDLPTNDPPTNDDHDAGPPPATAPAFGEAGDVLSEFGHVHDTAEAATLLDPTTKEVLRAALRQMWESELHLRQGDPATALPHAYKALGYIKQVQQADRIYLARTGIEVPPIDFDRRLRGEREGLADRRDPLAAATSPDPVPALAWQALQDTPDARRKAPDFDALERWVRERDAPGLDPLAVIAAIDAVRQDPACDRCRARLRAALWPLLPRPPATSGMRPRADAAGAAYLDALDAEAVQ